MRSMDRNRLHSMAQLDGRPNGDQEVATGDQEVANSGNILSWRLFMKYFFGHSLNVRCQNDTVR